MFYFQQTTPTFAIIWEQFPLEDSEPCLWCGRLLCSLGCIGRLHRYNQCQKLEPSWSPGPTRSRNQNRIGFHEAETLYRHHFKHASSGTISVDGYSGAHPGHAWIGTENDTGVGKVQRTPVKEPIDGWSQLNLGNSLRSCGSSNTYWCDRKWVDS